MVYGETFALIAAFSWALGGITLKNPSTQLPPFYLSKWRNIAALIIIAFFTIFSGLVNQLGAVPLKSIIYIILSGVVGLTLGSTFHIKALSYINLSKASPICNSLWISLVGIASYFFLGEIITVNMLLGALLILLGMTLLTNEKSLSSQDKSDNYKGYFFSFLAGTCWAIASVFLKLGISGVHPFLVNFIRLPAAILPLIILSRGEKLKNISRNNLNWLLVLTCTSGILDQVVASYFFFTAIQHIGIAKTTILGVTSPLFVAPLSIIFLKEKITLKVALGTILCVLGAWFIILL
ncbi:MAG: hypothetical protein DDT22_01284 [candidate division WS2 bacterium]|nr:hypothetical protein [Candidatus Lithacetigena glycinireducens]MBT9175604.1 hypothetical protein [Candidatus Lithacetigena glycinireducens]